jgi:cytochrome oxidase Cu insertion factor (SCO1/SenC/PrrC family)
MRTLLVSLLVLGAAAAPAQLGPKDGRDLPASDLDRVQVGQPAPDFSLEDVAGARVTLSGLRGKRVALVFYRGYW